MTDQLNGSSLSASDERESQVSAMFDGELAAAECELLSRRLVRDEALKLKWSRYALIGAAMRSDPLTNRDVVAGRVRIALESDKVHKGAGVGAVRSGFYKGALGTAIAAGVAAAAILLVRVPQPAVDDGALVASSATQPAAAVVAVPAQTAAVPPAASRVAATRAPAGALPSYVTPTNAGASASSVQAQYANYFVAHSEYVTPFARLNRLSALATADGDADVVVPQPATGAPPAAVIVEATPDDEADAVR